MSQVAAVRYGRRAQEVWLKYVRRLKKHLDEGRARLVVVRPEWRDRGVGPAVASAEAAIAGMEAVLARRRVEFGHMQVMASRSGPVWDALQADYEAKCAQVQYVCATICAAVKLLLDDDRELTLLGNSGLTVVQHRMLDGARALMLSKTQQYLTRAGAIFKPSVTETLETVA